jgi:hypothetical protein
MLRHPLARDWIQLDCAKSRDFSAFWPDGLQKGRLSA